jgi:crotonobetainyl-CoA:carnitine CoA-transferase CaiB-like acyl-CoA transferase
VGNGAPHRAERRILAVSQFGAGPFGTTVLADLGAEVVKIEDPAVGGDVARYIPPFLGERDSLYFQSTHGRPAPAGGDGIPRVARWR